MGEWYKIPVFDLQKPEKIPEFCGKKPDFCVKKPDFPKTGKKCPKTGKPEKIPEKGENTGKPVFQMKRA